MTTGSPPQQPPTRPRRSRARTLVPLAVAAWLVLEIWLLTVVADAIGGVTVLLMLLGGAVLGGYVIKRAGRRAWRRLADNVQAAQAAAAEGRPIDEAAGESGDNAGHTLPMLGGLLLMMPGFVSDAVGLLCLFPPTRAVLRRSLERSLSRRVAVPRPGTFGHAYRQARMHRPDGKVVPGEVVREDRPGSRPPNDDEPRPPLTR
ncbi:FxsA family membrane protein [Streptomyces sp. NPDC051776]|uniref:FxsA family membrane protein n=1 Tax=Streptomyces sp. NPDC051776 TaxID=3155414 RepID=UPI0034275EBD